MISEFKEIVLDPGNKRVCDSCNDLLTEDGIVKKECVLSNSSLYCAECYRKIHKNALYFNETKYFPETARYTPDQDVSKEKWY